MWCPPLVRGMEKDEAFRALARSFVCVKVSVRTKFKRPLYVRGNTCYAIALDKKGTEVGRLCAGQARGSIPLKSIMDLMSRARTGTRPERTEIERLVHLLQSDDWNIRLDALAFIRAMGPRARPAVPALVAVLKKRPQKAPEPGQVLRTLASFKAASAAAVPALAEILADPKESLAVRQTTALCLGQIGGTNPAIKKALATARQDKLEGIRLAAELARRGVGPRSKEAREKGVTHGRVWWLAFLWI